MDYTVLYGLGIALLVIAGSIAGVYYYNKMSKENKELFQKSLNLLSIVTGLGLDILQEVDLKHEKEIETISKILEESLEYTKTITDNLNKEDKKKMAFNYSITLCKNFNLELTENREDLIKRLIDLAFENEDIIVKNK